MNNDEEIRQPTNSAGASNDNLQQLIANTNGGWIYLPEGDYDPINVTRPNLIFLGEGEESRIIGNTQDSPVTIFAHNVILSNVTVLSEGNHPGIRFTMDYAVHCGISSVKIESEGDGIRKEHPPAASDRCTISGCEINAGGHGIHAQSGSGPLNFVWGNRGRSDKEFIKWGVDSSVLLGNEGSDILFTENSKGNLSHNPEMDNVNDESNSNVLLE